MNYALHALPALPVSDQHYYGNRQSAPHVMHGDLVTFRSVGAGPVKAIVTDANPPTTHPLFNNPETRVEITVTSQTNPIYARGDVLRVSATWLVYRGQSKLAQR